MPHGDFSDKTAYFCFATGMIALAGLINAHHHTWQTAIRGIGGNWKQREYFN